MEILFSIEWKSILLVLVILLVDILLIKLIEKKTDIHPELKRKLFHVTMGVVMLSFPFIFTNPISVGLLGVRSITSSFGGNKVTVSNITNSDGSTTTRQTIKKKIYNTIDSSVIDNNKIEVSETEEIS